MKDDQVILETLYWRVVLLPEQLYLGRSVVVLKRSSGDLADLNQDEILDFFELVKKLENLFRKTFGAVMFNWCCLMNNAFREENPKPQVHWHFRPRYSKEVEIDGEIFKDPNFGNHYLRGNDNEKVVSTEILKKINNKLQENLVLK